MIDGFTLWQDYVFISKWHPRILIPYSFWWDIRFEKNEIDDCGAHGWSVSRYKTWSVDNGV